MSEETLKDYETDVQSRKASGAPASDGALEADAEHQSDATIPEPPRCEESSPSSRDSGFESFGREIPADAPEEPEDSDLVPQDCSIDLTVLKLEGIQEQLGRLEKEFQSKLKYDAHKDRIIDHLHQELQAYRDDVLKKQTRSVIMDVIKIVDDIRRFTSHYRHQEPSAESHAKLLNFLESLPSDLEELFEWQGVKPFGGSASGSTFDPKRQRIMKKVETLEKANDRTIAESLRPGYEWDGQVVRPEMVAVFLYQSNPAEAELRSSNE